MNMLWAPSRRWLWRGLWLVGIWGMLLGLALGPAALQAEDRSRDPRWARPMDWPETENFYQVTPGLFRAAQPTIEAFREYEKFGIKTVLNLRKSHSDRSLLPADTRLNLVEVPMEAWDIEDAAIIAALKVIRDGPGPVLVHCQHGADRTGVVVAMYRLVFEGWTKAEALAELRDGGYGFHRIWQNIPEYIEEVDVEKIRAALGKVGPAEPEPPRVLQ